MANPIEALEMHRQVAAAAVVVAVVGIVASLLDLGVQNDHVRAVLTFSSIVSMSLGLYCAHGAVKLMMPAQPAPAAPLERVDVEDAGTKREVWSGAFARTILNSDTSPMEMRMTGSLKSIMAQAEEGLVASDAEKTRHLAAIWSMAACDLDDDPDQLAH